MPKFGSIGRLGRKLLIKNKIFWPNPEFWHFYQILDNSSRITHSNLISHAPIDKTFNCALGIKKVIKKHFFDGRHFEIRNLGWISGDAWGQPTGNPQKSLSLERTWDLILQKKILDWKWLISEKKTPKLISLPLSE